MKIGGSTLGSHDTTLLDLVKLQQEGEEVVVVHGGGNVISRWMQRQGIPPQFVGGLRVTDADSLEIVVAVLGGLINKELVSLMEQLGGRCVGISGIDNCMLTCGIANPELGYVGEIQMVNAAPIRSLLDSGCIPMIAPLGVHGFDGSENAGKPLNINGDTVAGELARELQADRLVFLTDVAGRDGQRRPGHPAPGPAPGQHPAQLGRGGRRNDPQAAGLPAGPRGRRRGRHRRRSPARRPARLPAGPRHRHHDHGDCARAGVGGSLDV